MCARSVLGLVLALRACGPAPSPRPVAAVVASVAPPPAPSAPAPPRPPPAPPPLPACRVDPLPIVTTPTPPGVCAPVAAHHAAGARAKLAKHYAPTAAKAKLVITFACDPVVGPPAEITYEYGSGHGQDLALVRLRRNGAALEALRIARPPYGLGRPSSFEVERGTVPAAALDALLPAARALLLAKLKERIPADATDRSDFFSSGDFHGLLRLRDAAGHVLERAFTGYPSSQEQLQSMPMAEVAELLYPLVDGIRWERAPVDDDVRAFFVGRYVAAGLTPHPGRAAWWVKERLVMMAEQAGTPSLVPSLVELALASGGDASVVRTREYAVDTLAALAGFDVRKDPQSEARPIADTAGDYARACRR